MKVTLNREDMRGWKIMHIQRLTYIIVGVLFMVSHVWGQSIQLKGIVLDGERNAPMEFANVVLQTRDSIFITGVSTDTRGRFVLDKITGGDYRLVVSSVGYVNTIVDLVGCVKSVDLGKMVLSPESVTLEDVTVIATNIVNKSDRKVVFPSERQMTISSNGANLLRSMMLPRVEVNPMTNAISLAGKGELQLRINGVEVSEKEIVALQPVDIIRVEFIENPGLRYGKVDAVLNYITRRHESGGSVSVDLMNSPHVLMGEDQISARFNYKKSELGLSYALSTRDFFDLWRDNEELFRFEDGSTMNREEVGKPGRYTRQTHNFLLNYNNQQDNQSYFNATLNYYSNIVPHNMDFYSDLRSSRSFDQLIRMSDLNDQYIHRPSLDLYYMYPLRHKQSLIFNLVATYIHTNQDRTYQEQLDQVYLTNVTSGIRGKKYSLIGEGIYEKEIQAGRLSAGLKHAHSFSDNAYAGTFQCKTEMRQADTYLYSEFAGKMKELDYTLGLGVTRSWLRQEGESDYETYVFRPRVTLRYSFSPRFYMRLKAGIENALPSLSDLSAVEQWIDSLQIQQGNPEVLPYKQYTTDFYTEYQIRKFTISGSLFYMNAPKAIMETIYQKDGLFIRTMENQRRMQRLNGELTVKTGMFWNILQFSLVGGVNRYWSDGHTYSHRYTNWYYRAQAMAMYKQWIVMGGIHSNWNWFWGETMSGGENGMELLVMYCHKNMTIGMGATNPFMHNFKIGNERWNQNASYKRRNYLNEISNAYFLKFTWNFNFGRKYNTTRKRLNNQDSDAGVMSVGK